MKSTASWLRNTATFGVWPSGVPTISADEHREHECVPLLMHVQDGKAIREAHRMGARALSYVSFYDTFVLRAGCESETEAEW